MDNERWAAAWATVDELIANQTYEQASERVEEILVDARAAGDDGTVTRALVSLTQLRLALHGPERAVTTLTDEPWPDASEDRRILRLMRAQALRDYLNRYAWQIRQREEIVGGDDEDLSKWTAERIQREIHAELGALWSRRETWGTAPLGDLGAYIVQNNYPPRIRGTLRDTVTYLWLELLEDRSWWSAEHENTTFRLDLDTLLADAEPADDSEVTDDGRHPLSRIHSLLADLESWHTTGERPEAAFEARRRWLQVLGSSFSQAADTARLRADLELRLDRLGSGFPWWSMGMADLARSHQRESGTAADALIRAIDIARRGQRTHPKSFGGRQCRQIVETIEAPRFHFEGMAIDGPERRSLRLRHANVERVWLRAHAIDVAARLRGGESPMPSHQDSRFLLASEPVAEWSVDLPPTPDYLDHATDIVPPLGAGAYMITASARESFGDHVNQTVSLGLQIGDPVPVFRHLQGGGFEVTVRSGRSGETLSGARIEVFPAHRSGEPIAVLTTDDSGRASWSPPDSQAQTRRRFNGQWALLIHHGGEVVHVGRWARHQGPSRQASERDLVLLYTDRSVYRPGQEVLWKAVAYQQFVDQDGVVERYEARPDASLVVTLADTSGQEVAKASVTTGDFGSASGRFTVPTGRALGSWSLRTDVGTAYSRIQVEEYKRPTFEVELDEPSAALRLNVEAEIEGEARYYFGLPVTEGRVRWRVERSAVWPGWWHWYRPPVRPQVIATGDSELDAEGRFTVRFLPEADERLAGDDAEGADANPWRDVGYRYQISADVTSEGGETRSAERAVRLGFVAVEARLTAEQRFVRAGDAARVTVRRTNLDGQPLAGVGRWRIHRLDQPDQTPLPADLPDELRPAWVAPPAADPHATEGDGRAPRWSTHYSARRLLGTWPDADEVDSGELEHGADGLATLSAELDAGAYRVHYRTEDAYGGVVERAVELVVVGEAPLRLPALLELEEASVEVGETARLLVHSGLDDQQAVLEIVRGLDVVDRQTLRFDRGDRSAPRILDIPITDAHRGGFVVRLTLMRDHQMLHQEESLDVPWSDRVLGVEFETFRDLLRPGQAETWSVTVRRPDGEPVAAEAAEVLTYMFDRGLDLFASHNPPSIDGLYPRFAWSRSPESGLGGAPTLRVARHQWGEVDPAPVLHDDRLQVFSGWAIGGPGIRHRPMEMRMMKRGDGAEAMIANDTMEVVDTITVTTESRTSAAVADDAGAPPAPPPPPPPPEEGGAAPEADSVREDFAETAFWFPSLRTGDDGSVRFEFTVPDSVTSWHVWVHALTRDLRAGRLHRQAQTTKDLLVRPQMPRFLREGDRAELRVVVDNTGDSPLDGTLTLDLRDPETDEDLAASFGVDPASITDVPFEVGPRQSTTLQFQIEAPRRPGPVSLTVRGRAGEWADGERRPLPVLPSRLHLSRSRFAMLRGGDAASRVLDFGVTQPQVDDPSMSHESFVVTLDAQLFNTVLRALPYLVDYPYECVEQTLNRYLATGLLSHLFDRYPSIEALGTRLAADRDERLERWDADDPNRRLLLEETPWLREARGGDDREAEMALLKVLDPEIARQHRASALAQITEMQRPDGGFPWWPGGPASPFMTLYVLDGLARGIEAGLDVPKPIVSRAWTYIERHLRERWNQNIEESWHSVAYLSWVLSSYPDASWTGGVFSDDTRRLLLDRAFKSWRHLAPRTKLYLAMALHRGDRVDDAGLLLESVLDSAITDPDLGTYWQPERLAWLWYHDTVETHALALRTLVELRPDDPRIDGLAQWLLLEKKLSHWKSTRATAEALYALAAYLELQGGLGQPQAVRVALAGDEQRFVFEPDEAEPRRRIVLEGADVASVFTDGGGKVDVATDDSGFVVATATWHFATDRLPEASDGDLFDVERRFFRRVPTDTGHQLEPLTESTTLEVGDEVEVQLTLTARHAAEYVHLRDPRGAGFEPGVVRSGHEWRDGVGFYREVRDSGTNFFIEWLPAGEVVLRHRLRATMGGTFRVGPATVQSMYAPEFTAHSSGVELDVGDK